MVYKNPPKYLSIGETYFRETSLSFLLAVRAFSESFTRHYFPPTHLPMRFSHYHCVKSTFGSFRELHFNLSLSTSKNQHTRSAERLFKITIPQQL